MQRLEVSGAVWPIYGSLGVKRLKEENLGQGHGCDEKTISGRIACCSHVLYQRMFSREQEHPDVNYWTDRGSMRAVGPQKQEMMMNSNLASCFGASIQWKPYNSPNNIRYAAQVDRDSYSLRAGRSGDRIPVGARFSAPIQPAPVLAQSPGKWIPCLFWWSKAAGAWRSPPTSI
jgi:hypothetical protein